MSLYTAVQLWTDGACSPNPGMGGWAAILIFGSKAKIIGGYKSGTTNNRMETTAVLRALRMLKQPCEVALYTDSQYVIQCLAKLGRNHVPTKNMDLWVDILKVVGQHIVSTNKVAGHAEVRFNELADSYAVWCRESRSNMEMYTNVDEIGGPL